MDCILAPGTFSCRKRPRLSRAHYTVACVLGNQETADVQLGDVVVSQPTDTTGGEVQFDRGKHHCGSYFERTGCLNKPPTFLSATVEKLKAQHQQEGNQIRKIVSDMLR
jgi:hypothetical protein